MERCDNCGCNIFWVAKNALILGDLKTWCFVECLGCGKRGPYRKTTWGARRAWNKMNRRAKEGEL